MATFGMSSDFTGTAAGAGTDNTYNAFPATPTAGTGALAPDLSISGTPGSYAAALPSSVSTFATAPSPYTTTTTLPSTTYAGTGRFNPASAVVDVAKDEFLSSSRANVKAASTTDRLAAIAKELADLQYRFDKIKLAIKYQLGEIASQYRQLVNEQQALKNTILATGIEAERKDLQAVRILAPLSGTNTLAAPTPYSNLYATTPGFYTPLAPATSVFGGDDAIIHLNKLHLPRTRNAVEWDQD